MIKDSERAWIAQNKEEVDKLLDSREEFRRVAFKIKEALGHDGYRRIMWSLVLMNKLQVKYKYGNWWKFYIADFPSPDISSYNEKFTEEEILDKVRTNLTKLGFTNEEIETIMGQIHRASRKRL